MFFELRLRKAIAYFLIWLQLLMPGLSLLPVTANASETKDMQSTIQGLNSLILDKDTSVRPELMAPTPSEKQPARQILPFPETKDNTDFVQFQKRNENEKAVQAAGELPELSLAPPSSAEASSQDLAKKMNNKDPDGADGSNKLASGAMQAGALLSQDNASAAAIDYARSIGEGLINQQVNDWLNQYGNAKVSLGTHQNLSGDLLVPLYETNKSLIFSQVGARTNQDRNTVNLGLGYRQYLNDWMLGINTFYDYDYTGKNKRIGVGTEAWTDYLKLAANGYIRQTNWHQSKLDKMEDYDERPANGFDLRANAYLPSWPNLGGSLKYEQYFGKGVSVAESASPDSLKNNPVVVTAGVDYTPFPLMTLSAKRSVGDSNETNVGVDFTYRFGVPWYQQVDADSVGLMRSLTGSKYDFVDRNYNIVMQYRKQDLLTISLPASILAQAAETVPLVLTVARAKYGLKGVDWRVDPLLTARGGHYRVLSPTELQITLPAYVFTRDGHAAQNYKISAIAADNKGNQSNTADTTISVIPSENVVNLTMSPNDKTLPVDANKGYTVTGVVTDGKGTPVGNQSVTFSIDGLVDANGHSGATISTLDGKQKDSNKITVKTQANGKAPVLLRSLVAGQGTVSAMMDNGNSSSGKVHFIADTTTAAVTALVAEDDNAIADGKATNSVLVTVKDKYGNPVNGAEVYLTASNEAKIAEKTITNAEGVAKATLTNVNAGPSTVTASLNESNKEVTLTFGVGKPSQAASSIKTDRSDYVAGDDITVSVTLKDDKHNAVTGKAAMLTNSAVTVPNSAVTPGSRWVEDHQSPGVYTRVYMAKTVSENQTATLSLLGWRQVSNKYSITANITQAVISELDVKDNNAIADGVDKNSVLATVKDNYGNPVNGATLALSASNGAHIAAQATTDQSGTVLVTLTNEKAGESKVTASFNHNSQTVSVRFGVGQPAQASSTVTTDKITYTVGDEMTVMVSLKDASNNGVTGAAAALTPNAVKVANATLKAGSRWTDNNDGTYRATYLAQTIGAGLKATLTLDGWSQPATSPVYIIKAGMPVQASSAINTDKTTYTAGDEMTVTVTLKDASNNGVTGAAASLTTNAVKVANATLKSSNWTDNNDGTYSATYLAQTSGTGLKATLTLDGWGQSATSPAYAITVGAAVPVNSAITTDKTTYTAGDEMAVTVTLKDASNNDVTGAAAALTTNAVKVA
ncbi:inverse autotransporter beta domain-containing protein, partial [Yersinia proxima]